MDQERIEYFRQVLHEEMRTLLGEAGKTVSEMTAENVNFPDPTDRAATGVAPPPFRFAVVVRGHVALTSARHDIEGEEDGRRRP